MQNNFINNEIWILSFGGGFQRAEIYKDLIEEKIRSDFKNAIKEKVNNIIEEFYVGKNIDGEQHIDILVKVKTWIDSKFSHILLNDEIRFGVVQKLINLHLKYLWCLGHLPLPPHCPFDRIIISKLKIKKPPAWTKLNSVDEYRRLVEKAVIIAGERPIAEWELEVFSRR